MSVPTPLIKNGFQLAEPTPAPFHKSQRHLYLPVTPPTLQNEMKIFPLTPAVVAVSAILFCATNLHAQIAGPLTEGFIAGDGQRITYTPNTNLDQGNATATEGGNLWANGSAWGRNGAGVNRQVVSGNYLSWTNALSNVQTTIQLRREFQDQGTTPYQLNFRVEMANLEGLNLTDSEYTDPTSGTSNSDRAKAFFSLHNTPTISRLSLDDTSWYIEASAGYWHVLAGNGEGTGFSTPVALAPVIVGETYDISVSILSSTWTVEIHAINSDATYSLSNLSYINDTINNYITMRTYMDNVQTTSQLKPFEINVHEISLNQIPEPSLVGVVLAASALLGVGLMRRKRHSV